MSLPYFPFFPADWLSSPDIVVMSRSERGMYIQLLAYSWIDRDGGVPDVQSVLRKMAGYGVREKLPMELIHRLFPPHPTVPGKLANPRLFSEWQRANEVSERQREKGKKGGRPKANEKPGVFSGKAVGSSRLKPDESLREERREEEIKGESAPSAPARNASVVPISAELPANPPTGTEALAEFLALQIARRGARPPAPEMHAKRVACIASRIGDVGEADMNRAVYWWLCDASENHPKEAAWIFKYPDFLAVRGEIDRVEQALRAIEESA